jgi:hypothetical protein
VIEAIYSKTESDHLDWEATHLKTENNNLSWEAIYFKRESVLWDQEATG